LLLCRKVLQQKSSELRLLSWQLISRMRRYQIFRWESESDFAHAAAAGDAPGRVEGDSVRAGERWIMEREKEIAKLVNVLRRTSRMALQSEWTGGAEDVAAFCIDQYNRVLARLKEIDEGVGAVFDPLPAGSSLTVAAMACRQLAAYYEDEVGRQGSEDW